MPNLIKKSFAKDYKTYAELIQLPDVETQLAGKEIMKIELEFRSTTKCMPGINNYRLNARVLNSGSAEICTIEIEKGGCGNFDPSAPEPIKVFPMTCTPKQSN
jgi:hypothetical protein